MDPSEELRERLKKAAEDGATVYLDDGQIVIVTPQADGSVVSWRAELDQPVFDYRARLTRPYDGDSFWVELDQGMGSRQEEELRLLGVSAPEKYQPGGLESRDFVVAWFAQVSQTRKWPLYVVTVPNNTIEPTERRTFVRYLATVSDIVDGSRVLNAALATFLSQHPEWGHGI